MRARLAGDKAIETEYVTFVRIREEMRVNLYPDKSQRWPPPPTTTTTRMSLRVGRCDLLKWVHFVRKRGHHRARRGLLMKTLTMIDVVPVASVVYYYDHVKKGDSHPAATHPTLEHPQTPILVQHGIRPGHVQISFTLSSSYDIIYYSLPRSDATQAKNHVWSRRDDCGSGVAV